MIRILLILLGREIIQQHWKTLLCASIIWLSLGAFILIDALDGKTLIHSRYFGYFLLPDGLLSLAAAAWSTGTARKMRIVQGVVLLCVGLLIISATPASNFALAMVLGLCFLIDGGMRIGSAWVVRYPRWRLGLASGIMEVIIAIITLQPWPTWYAGTVGFNVGAAMIFAGIGILNIALRLRKLDASTTLGSILGRGHRLAKRVHRLKPDSTDLIVHVWTPTGTAMTPLRQRAISRYIAAVDVNGTISTGHAALEMGKHVYISHYPAVEIDRSPNEFTRILRATADNNVPGRFLPSYEEEAAEWCQSTVQVTIRNIDATRLLHFWTQYKSDPTYNLTNRNCSSVVADALDAALEGVYRKHRWPLFAALHALIFPELRAAALIRKRAELMAWTPGLVLDYSRALSAIIDPPSFLISLSRLRIVRKHTPLGQEDN